METARAHLLSAEYREPMLNTLRRNAERERTPLVAIQARLDTTRGIRASVA
ncbi:hypothetical protein RA280_06975 [Cupriavidus sp. CV2]|uniref:hypothetical protein n=1 Tax=Cupriavidus ulmosensis TaxID=3065913 RepID=UPI00296ABA5E|nr:hypothetical protein [Cupriavidus sp. CV2]MDW3681493.1 hypothetical protein [Cupriavidus sp. CV2]